jgi:hypothetical protein
MRIRVRALITWLTVGALLVASPAWAQQHVVDSTTLQQAIAAERDADAANRQVIERVLARPDVQAVAGKLGLDVKDARTAIASLSGDDLAAVAQSAQAAEADLAGGQSRTVTISLTTLLLIIIIVILVAD